MNRQEIISFVRQINQTLGFMPRLIGGAACVLHAVRDETADLDFASTEAEFRIITRLPKAEIKLDGRLCLVPSLGLDTMKSDEWGEEDWEEVDGIPVLTLPVLLAFYAKLNRPKDQATLEILRAILR
jgi:hypothetical protein